MVVLRDPEYKGYAIKRIVAKPGLGVREGRTNLRERIVIERAVFGREEWHWSSSFSLPRQQPGRHDQEKKHERTW